MRASELSKLERDIRVALGHAQDLLMAEHRLRIGIYWAIAISTLVTVLCAFLQPWTVTLLCAQTSAWFIHAGFRSYRRERHLWQAADRLSQMRKLFDIWGDGADEMGYRCGKF